MNQAPHFPVGSKVVAYIRDSGGAKQDLSVIQQEQVIRQWADENGMNVVRFFIDAARSGASVIKRESFLEMIGWLERGQDVAAVVVWSLSRFSRDIDDAQWYLAKIRQGGYQIYSLEENIPPGNIGRIIESLHLYMADQYRVELAANVKRGQLYVVRHFHAWPHPNPPIGYRKVPIDAGLHRDGSHRVLHGLEPDPVYAPLVRLAFEMKITGATVREIRDATRLLPNLAHYSLVWRNKIYLGIMEWGGEIIEGFCEPIIDLDTWKAVQEMNVRNTERRIGTVHPRSATSSALLSGLVFCKNCGSNLRAANYHQNRTGRLEQWRYYRCAGKHNGYEKCDAKMIPADYLEDQVMGVVKSTLLDHDLLCAAYEKYRDTHSERAHEQQARLTALREDLAQAEKRIRNLTTAIADGRHSKALMERLAEQEALREELLDDLRNFQDGDIVVFKELDRDELITLGQVVWQRLETGSHRVRQRLVRAIVDRVDVVNLSTRRGEIDLHGDISINPAFAALTLDN